MNNNSIQLVKNVKEQVILPLQEKALEIMPESISMEEKRKIMKSFYLAFDKNPDLATCTPNSIAKAIMDCAETGLYPNTFHKHGDLIRYGQECQFQPQYFGLVHMARKTGNFKSMTVGEIFKNDKVIASEGFDNEFRIEKNYMDPGGKEPYAYYAAYTTFDGDKQFRIWPRERCEAHGRKFSKAYHKAWQNSFDEMAKKTVLKNLLKLAPKTDSLAKLLDEPELVVDVDVEATETKPPLLKNGMSSADLQEMVNPSAPAQEAKPKKKVTRRRVKKDKEPTQAPNEEPKPEPKEEPNSTGLVDDFIDGIEDAESQLEEFSQHKQANIEIYQAIDNYLKNPRVIADAKLQKKLGSLSTCWLTTDDKPLITAGIRHALENDFQAIDTLIQVKTR